MRVLVVEDYDPIRNAVLRAVRENGGVATGVSTGEEGLWAAKNQELDVIVLDIMLPDMSGLVVLESLRKAGVQVPVLCLTAKDTLQDRLNGLDLGADDYLVKPFFMSELISRIRVLMRRGGAVMSEVTVIGDLEVDTSARRVRLGGRVVDLSAREYLILEFLIQRSGRVTTRAEILDHVYSSYEAVSPNLVDVYVGYLRKKLHQPGFRTYLQTKRGLGYVLEEGDWV